jgi:hypothetical protein
VSAPATPLKLMLSMPCWLERNGAAIKTPERKAAWHADCPDPIWCPCPAHHPAQPAALNPDLPKTTKSVERPEESP